MSTPPGYEKKGTGEVVSVALMQENHQPVLLRSDRHPLLSALERLQAGTTVGELAADYFAGSDTDAMELLSTLLDKGCLMRPVPSAALPPQTVRERFDRLLAYFAEFETAETNRYDYLRRVQESHVVFLGLGSMTSWILSHLVASGVGRITGVDPDRVEPSNLARQAFYRESDVGTVKVTATSGIVHSLNSTTRFDGIEAQLRSATDAFEILGRLDRPDLVILTADQPLWVIAEWAAHACNLLDLPLLRVNVRSVGPFKNGAGTACPACELGRLRQSPGAEAILSYRSSSSYRSAFNSATISTEIAVQASIAAHEAVGHLTGAWAPLSINASLQVTPPPALHAERRAVMPNADCSACGTSARARDGAAPR
ncbi:ThiF family adenylyltransferase [Nonomuraea sp. NPDC003201]